MNLQQFLVALFNVITMGGIVIWVESTAMSGGKKQAIGIVFIVLGIILGVVVSGLIVLK